MALPKIEQPLYELVIPSTEKKVKYRPFTVKEEKILLIAQESKDIDQVILSIKQIINNCIEGLNVETLAMFDLEYILINLRAKSVSNEIEFKIKDPETEESIELSLDINDIEIKKDADHEKIIKINSDISLVMSYPRIDQIRILKDANDDNKNDLLFKMMISCIDSVVQGEEVMNLKDFSESEVDEFIDSLSTTHIEEIKHFFDTMPTLRYEKEYTRSDGKKKKFVAQGTETFFI